jgi:hypothetical protein
VNGNDDEITMVEDESYSKSLRLRALQQSQHRHHHHHPLEHENYEDVPPHHLRSTTTSILESINEENDVFSEIEKLLLPKSNVDVPSLTNVVVDDENGDEERIENGTDINWVVGEWTHCLDSECFNWNTGELIYTFIFNWRESRIINVHK